MKKIFDLNRIDDLFLLHPGLEEETEELKKRPGRPTMSMTMSWRRPGYPAISADC